MTSFALDKVQLLFLIPFNKVYTGFDIVLVSSTYGAKYVKASPQSLVITYCYMPFCFAWHPTSYNQYTDQKDENYR